MTPVSTLEQSSPGALRYDSYNPLIRISYLVTSDILSLLLAVFISLTIKSIQSGGLNWPNYLRLWPLLFVFPAVYWVAGLYSSISLSPPEELRRATLSSVFVFMTLAAATVSFRGATAYYTWTTLLCMSLSIILVPLLRGATRYLFAREVWWGSPAVIFGAGPAGRRVVRTLLVQPGIGLRPIAVVDDEAEPGEFIDGIPVVGGHELAALAPESHRLAHAVVAMPGKPTSSFMGTMERHGLHFSRILMIPNLASVSAAEDHGHSHHVMNASLPWVGAAPGGLCTLEADTKNVGGMLGLEVCQQAFLSERQWPKRALDLTLTLLAAIFVIPLIAIIAMWIKIDSPGPVFYAHQRVGYEGKPFGAWKFRSMVQNADQVLGQYLERNPQLREEWERDHKLRRDPRVTLIGGILRQTSLDELPQLWNVLRGEMSLVGPRPIVTEEISKYGPQFMLYTKVKSGMTGLWQISGRNDTSYDQRVRLDSFYVRNWSVWLDLYILFKTIKVVLFRKGAY